QAPAGYGKSTLLQSWFEALVGDGMSAAWVSLDHRDQAAPRLFQYLHAAFTAAGHRLNFEPHDHADADTNAARWANALLQSSRPTFLFLDDAHHLNGSEALSYLQALIE